MEISLQGLKEAFQDNCYIAEDEVIMTVYWALKLGKPLLIEGEPGVGKTEVAKVLSSVFATELIRLQCYEGLDESRALYEWNYQRQLLKIQLQKDCLTDTIEKDLFDREYLLERPLLKAITVSRRPVLLIDEIDKTDEQFEAFLFELLSEYQVTIPEWGTIKAKNVPIVVLTSNHDRDLSDGLRRRCVYLYLEYPSIQKETLILAKKVPGLGPKLAHEIATALQLIRRFPELEKKPAIAESLDWARALVMMGTDALDETAVNNTLGLIFKHGADLRHFKDKGGAEELCVQIRECPEGEARGYSECGKADC